MIEPEVAGSLGKEKKLDNSVFPPHIKKLHYEFDGRLGDDILESFPCYIVTGVAIFFETKTLYFLYSKIEVIFEKIRVLNFNILIL